MTAHERNIQASIDPVKLDRLAEVAIKVGLQLKPGQDLLLTAPTVALPLVRRVAEQLREKRGLQNFDCILTSALFLLKMRRAAAKMGHLQS